MLFNLFFSVFCFSQQQYNKQHTYLDALELARIVNLSKQTVNKEKSYKLEDLINSFDKIIAKYDQKSELKKNPFLKDFILEKREEPNNKFGIKIPLWEDIFSKTDYENLSNAESFFSPDNKAASATSLNWQTSAVNGIANFMAGRFKQEILHVAINQLFQKVTQGKDSLLVSTIFPKTYKQVKSIYSKSGKSYYATDIQILRQLAQIDLDALPENIINNFSFFNPESDSLVKSDMFVLGKNIIKGSQRGQSLDRLLSSISDESLSNMPRLNNLLNLADLISQATLNKAGSDDIWVNSFSKLPTDKKSLDNPEIRYFYGLLYQQLIQIPELKKHFINYQEKDRSFIAIEMQQLLNLANNLRNAENFLSAKKFNIQSVADLTAYSSEITKVLSGFNNSIQHIQGIAIEPTLFETTDKYIAIAESILKKDYQKFIPMLIIYFASMDSDSKSLRTLSFFTQLASLQNAAEMEALLNAYALPIGSSSIKRNSNFNISLNGYVGVTGGFEIPVADSTNVVGNIGLSAPIGVTVSFGTKNCGSVSVFASIFDLGSIMNFRIPNNNSSFSKVKFENFLAPGLGVYYNFPKMPFTAGIHANYIPNIREIANIRYSAFRMNVSFLVDIPFFTIFNKEKK